MPLGVVQVTAALDMVVLADEVLAEVLKVVHLEDQIMEIRLLLALWMNQEGIDGLIL